jgi:hypothetical protein
MANEKLPKLERRRGEVLVTIHRKNKQYPATYSGDDGAKKWADALAALKAPPHGLR